MTNKLLAAKFGVLTPDIAARTQDHPSGAEFGVLSFDFAARRD